MKIEKRFSKNLNDIFWPTEDQIKNEMWNVGGILKKQSNQIFKFDVRDMSKLENNLLGKYGNTQSKAEKFVFETLNKWVILDIEELHNYIKNNKLNTVHLDDLIDNLNWNMYINKNN